MIWRTVCATVLTMFAVADAVNGAANLFALIGAWLAGSLWTSIIADRREQR